MVGVNTRSVACSLKKLNFNVYSADYFGTLDLQQCTKEYKSILNQEPNKSCGFFTKNFRSTDLSYLAGDFVDDADFIICLAGSSPEHFPKDKILGNKSIKDVENKYKFYKNFKNVFNIPKTYRISDSNEVREIISNYPDKKFIIKPVRGSGGYGIREFEKLEENLVNHEENHEENIDFSDLLLQERLEGHSISASVLSTKSESKTILTSKQIIGSAYLGQREPYGYCGNISPLLDDHGATEVAEEIISQLPLVGSNGVDFVIKDGELYLIEVNPRLQGTVECAEAVLNVNIMEAHIEACQGTIIDIPTPNRFAVKMIVHTRERSRVGKLDIEGINDIPVENVIIEEGEPVATVITSGKIFENTVYSAKRMVEQVYNNLNPASDNY